MGVNVSKDNQRVVIRSKHSSNLIEVESVESFSLDLKDCGSVTSSSSSICSENEHIGKRSDQKQKFTEGVTISGAKTIDKVSETGVKHLKNVQHAVPATENKTTAQQTVFDTDDNKPVSDAEKRLRMYEKEMKKSTQRNKCVSGRSHKDDSKENMPVPQKQTQTHILMKNDDILKVRRRGVFSDEIISDNPSQTLSPVTSSKPGQNDILYQLGKEGIVKPMTEEEKTKGELKSLGLIKQNNEDNSSKKVIVPRLAPLKVESVWEKVPEAELKAPWEKGPLRQDNTRCLTPSDILPPMRTKNGQTWEDDIMPLEVKSNESAKLKIKMMDIDLL